MLVLVMCVVLAAEDPALADRSKADQIQFFESRIRPLLADHCIACHGPKKQWSGLRLDSFEGMLRGGDSGAAFVPGKPEESLLIQAIRQEDPDLRMPRNSKLNDQQIADLVRWVEIGAPFPVATVDAAKIRDPEHWSFQPPASQVVPDVHNDEWPQSPVDHFILEKLEASQLAPAPPADKRTLIRRVTFALTGLPPSQHEISAFLADDSADAFARVIDRLLDSPSFGERWARHWLDVARYADSNGLDENVAHGNAWRYRDYVVAAFNRDTPFNQFVLEQLAGDLLPYETEEQQHEQLIATGFLGIGPKVLAETDEAKMRMDIIDEQIDTTGRAFLGLTLGCARCHDHKFDPIDTADYYGLAGIFKSTKSMRKYTKLAEWHENLLPSAAASAIQAEYDKNLAVKKMAIAEFTAKADKEARDKLEAGATPPDKLETLYPEATKAELAKIQKELAEFEKAGPDLPSAMGVVDDAVTNVAIHVRGDPLKLGDVVVRHTPPTIRGATVPQFTDTESGRRQLAQWLADPRHPLTSRVFVNRVWRWTFGKGLVRSTDNFGLQGEAPSHPELLDWLANRFTAEGGSVKSLLRLILNSSTYQQSSTATSESLARDPENRLFSRFEVRRLEAESVRDSLLVVADQLDTAMGGSLLSLKNRAYFFDHTSKDATTYESRRRSIYLPVVRNNVFEIFQLLDFPSPTVSSSDRASTVVAPQALLMLNSDFVMQSAANLADRLLADAADDEQRLGLLYEIAYGREPTAEQRDADRAFLANVSREFAETDSDQRRRKAWSALCHTALAANEFIYVK